MAKEVWQAAHVALHWRVVNVLARIFGLLAIAAGLAFGGWAMRFFLRPELPTQVATVSGSVVVDYAVIGVFCLLIGSAFIAVRPYRPDLTQGSERSWWTGEQR